MSVLRLLQSSKDPYGPSGPSSAPSRGTAVPTLVLDIPTYGAVFMSAPDDPLLPPDEFKPRNDVVVHGELVITLPTSLGRRRVKAIRVGVKSILTLDLKGGRMGEKDTLFRRTVELAENPNCNVVLEPGSTVFDFTLILPANHPPHDWHHNGKLRHFLFAEIEGLPKSTGTSSFLSFRSKSHGPGAKSPTGHRSPKTPGSPSRSRSNSPLPSPSLDSALQNPMSELSIRGRTMEVQAPAYEVTQSVSTASSSSNSTPPPDEWLKGTYKTERTLMLIYNPSPTGEVTILNLDFSSIAEDLGVWNIKLDSNPWTICALLRCQLNFTSLSPAATIFYFRVSLAQTHAISSPRDDPNTTEPIVSTRNFLIAEQGRRPPPENPYPRRDWPALWRGVEAGGKDEGDLDLELRGRLPNDDQGRPSTVAGVSTPIKVSHTIQIEIFFSIYGYDQQGQPMKIPAAGGSRLLKIHRPVVVPSCLLIHQVVNLPSYEDHKKETFFSKTINVACPVCGIRPSERICTTCPSGLAPHPRHDHDPKLVGDPSGRCRMCSQGTMPGGSGFQNCACGMSIEQMEDRMKRMMEEERGQRGMDRIVQSNKEAVERGRTRASIS